MIEVRVCESTSTLDWIDVSGVDLSDWLERAVLDDANATDCLYLLILPKRYNQYRMLPCPFDQLNKISSTWKLPPAYLRMLAKKLPALLSFSSEGSNGNPTETGLVLKAQTAAFWEFCLATAWNSSSKATRNVLSGLTLREVNELRLYVHGRHVVGPLHYLSLPVLVVDMAVEKLDRWVEMRSHRVSCIQETIGMDTYLRKPVTQTLQQSEHKQINFTEVLTQLTGVSTSIADLNAYGQTQERFVLQIRKMLHEAHGSSDPPPPAVLAFHQKMDYLESCLQGSRDAITYLQSSVQAQVQTVSHVVAVSGTRLLTSSRCIALCHSVTTG